jgi:hypothetical protein
MEGSGARFVSPTGYVELNNEDYSIDIKSTRSREEVVPKEDLAFYFQTYLAPKYGLNNINVNNVASFMKELEMNWSKLTPELKDMVLNIMVDGILVGDNYDFKNSLLTKLGVRQNATPEIINQPGKESFSKSNFGSTQDYVYILLAVIVLGIMFYLLTNKTKTGGFPKMM